MVKIRLRRTGAKKQPHYRVVVTDSRAPRDGKVIETIGHYNPRTDPATVEIDVERALHWLSVGAQPTAAVERMLDKLGVLAQVAAVRRGEVSPEALAPQLLAEQASAAVAVAEEADAEAEEPVEEEAGIDIEAETEDEAEEEDEDDDGEDEDEADDEDDDEADDDEAGDDEAGDDEDEADDEADDDEEDEDDDEDEADDPESDEADDVNDD
jgi:small subunit ribosomal protein S16